MKKIIFFKKLTFSNFESFFQKKKNLYEILQLDQTATPEEIKNSYYKLAKQYHPDIAKGKEEIFKEINNAYEILSDDNQRKKYDNQWIGFKYKWQKPDKKQKNNINKEEEQKRNV